MPSSRVDLGAGSTISRITLRRADDSRILSVGIHVSMRGANSPLGRGPGDACSFARYGGAVARPSQRLAHDLSVMPAILIHLQRGPARART